MVALIEKSSDVPTIKISPPPKPGKKDRMVRDIAIIKKKYPGRVPVLLTRDPKEKCLPLLEKVKFLVPYESSMSVFLNQIRIRLKLKSAQSLFLMLRNGTAIPSMSKHVQEVYNEYKDEDQYLRMTYISQEIFGCRNNRTH